MSYCCTCLAVCTGCSLACHPCPELLRLPFSRALVPGTLLSRLLVNPQMFLKPLRSQSSPSVCFAVSAEPDLHTKQRNSCSCCKGKPPVWQPEAQGSARSRWELPGAGGRWGRQAAALGAAGSRGAVGTSPSKRWPVPASSLPHSSQVGSCSWRSPRGSPQAAAPYAQVGVGPACSLVSWGIGTSVLLVSVLFVPTWWERFSPDGHLRSALQQIELLSVPCPVKADGARFVTALFLRAGSALLLPGLFVSTRLNEPRVFSLLKERFHVIFVSVGLQENC